MPRLLGVPIRIFAPLHRQRPRVAVTLLSIRRSASRDRRVSAWNHWSRRAGSNRRPADYELVAAGFQGRPPASVNVYGARAWRRARFHGRPLLLWASAPVAVTVAVKVTIRGGGDPGSQVWIDHRDPRAPTVRGVPRRPSVPYRPPLAIMAAESSYLPLPKTGARRSLRQIRGGSEAPV